MRRFSSWLVVAGCGASAAPEHPTQPTSIVAIADAGVDATPDADIPDEVANAPAWIFRYNAPDRLETWSLRYSGETALPTTDVTTEPSIAAVVTPSTIAPGGTVTLAVTTTNYTIVNPTTGPTPKAGEGHFHYYLDDAADYIAAWTPSVTITTSPAERLGVHTVRLVLVSSAHVDITPTTDTTVTYTVQ
ncbi:MAG: hypothetical protein H0T79_24100 [Deltaproteobacteria bacterium]|nr:hypothetical protein [Deltaproteobacteria bacterium]